MKHLNFLSSLGSQSGSHRVVTKAVTVGSPSAHRRGITLKPLMFALLFLLCGVGQLWATTITLTESDVRSNTSYNTSEQTFTNGVQFGYINVMTNNSNGTPTNWAKNQVMQSKSGSYLYNKAALSTIQHVKVYIVVNDNALSVGYGTTEKPTENTIAKADATSGTQSVTYTKYANKTTTANQTATATTYDFDLSSYNATYFTIIPGGSTYIWKVEVTYEETSSGGGGSQDPTVSVTQSLEAFAYETGEPVAQSFSVSGSNLEDDVIVTAPTNFEVCATENGTYSSFITLTPTDGALAATTVYARLAENLAAGNYSGGNIIVSSEGATEQTVAVSGSVPYTINWYANNTTTPFATTYVAVGNTLALPATAPVPNNCGCTGLAFYGWYGEGNSYSNESTAPAIAAAGDAVSADKNYYAVFAEKNTTTGNDQTITLDYSSFGLTNSYAEKTATVSNVGFTVNQGYKGSGDVIQMNSTKGSGILYNTSAINGLKSVTVNVSSGDKTYTITTGTSQNPTANSQQSAITGTFNAAEGDTYFQLQVSGASYFSSIVVTYATSTTTYSNYATTCCTKHDVNLANSGTVTGKGTFSANPTSACEGATVSLTATPETGYELDEWSVAKAQGTVTVTDNQFTMPGEAVTVSATFKAKKHNVIFHKNFGEGDVKSTQEYTFAAAAANLKSIETIGWTREGFTFSGWNTESNGTGTAYADGFGFTLNTDADVNLYAQWVENTAHTVSYNGDTYINYTTKPGSVNDGGDLTVVYSITEGYELKSVVVTMGETTLTADEDYTADEDGVLVMITNGGITDDITISFTIEEIKYTVSLNAGTGSVSTEGWTLNEGVYTQTQASYNANIQLPSANPSAACAEDYGWTFAGWKIGEGVASETSDAQTLLAAGSNYKPESNVTLYAVYKRSQAGEGTTPKTASVTISDYATANNWANETKYSSITIDEYITASASTSGNNGKYYTNGTNWRLYRGDNGTLTISTASNCTLTSATITFTVDKNGTLSGEGEDGDVTSETAYNISGVSYTFTVGGGETGKTNGQVRVTAISVTYNKPADATIYYHSTPTCAAKYNVTIAEGIQNGTVTANVAKAVEGEKVTLTATPAEHYHLDAWTISKAQGTVTVTDNQFTMPGEAVTVSATFAINHHNVVFHKNAGDNPEVTATQDFAYGEQKALTANAFSRDNYNFGGWMTDANGTEANYADGASYTLNADADVNLYALWVPDNTRTITYTENEHIASYTAQATSVINTADNFTATFALVKGYKVIGVTVTMGGVALESGVSFTQTSLTVTKPEGGFTGNLVVTFTIEDIKYTVTLNAGSGTCETESLTQASLNATVALPSANPSKICASPEYGWTFAGWATEAVSQETTTAPTLLTGNYQPKADIALYAVYQRSEFGETPETKYISSALSDLTSSDVFVIVGNNGSNYAMSNDKGTSNPPAATAVTIDGNKITGEVADALKWNISGNATDGYTFYPNGSTTKWLYCTNDNNGVRVGTNEDKTFTVDGGYLKHAGTSRYVGVYNSSDWRCYTGNTGNIADQTFAYYKATAVYPTTTYYLSSPNCCQKYTITVDGEIANGSVAVTPNVVKACAGTELTLTATENENASRFKQWNLTGVESYSATTNPLNITMEASNLIVSAEFVDLYAITKDEQNGTLTLGASYAAQGDEVSISGEPINAQYENPVITVFKTGDENTKVTVSNGKFTMPGYAVTARIVCTPALAAMEAPELGDPTDATYQGITLHWTGVTGNEGYVLTVYKDEVAVEGLVNVAIAKDATSYTITTGLAANTAYTYSIYTKGNGTSTLEVNTPNSGNFSTGNYPAATLSLKEGSNEAYAFGSDLKVNSTINLPTELAGDGCQEGVVLVGWTDNAEFANTDAKPTEHYWAAGAQYTIATTADQLYAVFAIETGGTPVAWTVDNTNFSSVGTGSGYPPYNGDHTESGITYNTNQVMLQSSKVQFQKNAGVMYNKTAFGADIVSITIDGIDANISVYAGAEELSSTPNSGALSLSSGVYPVSAGNRFFRIVMGDATGAATSITVNLKGETSYSNYTLSCTNATIDHYELGGEYQTAFDKDESFNHTGLIVYAAYDEEGNTKVDITSSCSFSNPDMTTTGEKTITITYKNVEIASYNITVTYRKQANSPATFTAISGDMTPDDIKYAFNKGNASNDPYIASGAVRLYQSPGENNYGGFVTLKAAKGCAIDQVVVTTTNSFATTVAYSVDDNTTLSGSESVAKSSSYSTPTELNAEKVNIVNLGTGSNGRLEIASIKVYYTGEALDVHHYVLGGEYETEFEVGSEFSYEGLTVTAAYNQDETITEPIEGFTVQADLATIGAKKAEVYLGNEKIAEYDIDVTAVKSDAGLIYNPATVSLSIGGDFEAAELQYVDGFDGLSTITYASSNESLATVTEAGEVSLVPNASGEATITATFPGNNTYRKGIASYTINVSADPVEIPTELPNFADGSWIKVTDATSIHAGQYLMIAAANQDYALAPKKNTNNNRAAYVVKKFVAGEESVLSYDKEPAVLFVQNGVVGGQFGLYNINMEAGESNGYLQAATTSSSNYMTISANLNDVYTSWNISITGGVASIVALGSTYHNVMQYNNGSKLFSCYETASQQSLAIYRFVPEKYSVHYVADNIIPSTAPTNVLVDKNGSVTLPAAPTSSNDFTFLGWQVNGELKAAGTTVENIAANLVVYAKWEITVTGDEGDDISISDLTYSEEEQDLVVSGNITLTIDDETSASSITAQNGATIVVETPTATPLIVQAHSTVVVSDDADHLVVEDDGVVILDKADAQSQEFHISTAPGQDGNTSGQIKSYATANRITIAAMYMDVQLVSAAELAQINGGEQKYSRFWYSISAPFDINLNGGFYMTDGTPLVHNQHIQVWEFAPDQYANGGRGWKRCTTVMSGNKAHLIGFDPDAFVGGEANVPTVIRLKAENVTLGQQITSVSMTQNSGSARDYNYNGFPNPNMYHVNFNAPVQVYDNVSHSFHGFEDNNPRFVVGQPIFCKDEGSHSVAVREHSTSEWSAPSRVTETTYSFCLRILKQGARFYDNQMYVKASESALPTYEANKDMETMNDACNGSAIFWTNAYGKRLAVENAPLVNNQALYDLSIMTPAAGTYVLRQANEVEGADLYVTYEGQIVWNLSLGDYELDLAKGTTTGYGLLLVVQPNQMPTGVENGELLNGENGVQKILLNGQLYILRDGHLYDAVGKEMK